MQRRKTVMIKLLTMMGLLPSFRHFQLNRLNLDKLLQAEIKALQNNFNINWRERIKALQQQVKDEKEKQQGFKNWQQVINVAI
jgi:hypothetical protein